MLTGLFYCQEDPGRLMEDIEDTGGAGPSAQNSDDGLDAPGYRDSGQPGRAHTGLAWLVIALCVSFAVYQQNFSPPPAAEKQAGNPVGDALLDFQGRFWVGLLDWAGGDAQFEAAQFKDGISSLDAGDAWQRFRYLVLVGELEGAGRALEELADLRVRLEQAGVGLTEKQASVAVLLERLWRGEKEQDLGGVVLEEESRLQLTTALGWYGELVLSKFPEAGKVKPQDPRQAARETFDAGNRAFFLGGVALLMGILSLVFFLWALRQKRVAFGIGGVAGFGGIYLETFAIWMVLFFLINLAVGASRLAEESLYPALGAFFLSLGALAWPAIRGVPWTRLKSDIGLTTGRGAVLELSFGLLSYLMALPLMVVGVLFFLLILVVSSPVQSVAAGESFEPEAFPSHPIMEWIISGGSDFTMILLLACVAAPIVEEIMFRGLLYRYLRERSRHRGLLPSAVLSALFSSFLFAAIHPQGLAVVPVLMGLACGFCLAREWRGSLLSSMAAHGLNNYVALSMARLVLGG